MSCRKISIAILYLHAIAMLGLSGYGYTLYVSDDENWLILGSAAAMALAGMINMIRAVGFSFNDRCLRFRGVRFMYFAISTLFDGGLCAVAYFVWSDFDLSIYGGCMLGFLVAGLVPNCILASSKLVNEPNHNSQSETPEILNSNDCPSTHSSTNHRENITRNSHVFIEMDNISSSSNNFSQFEFEQKVNQLYRRLLGSIQRLDSEKIRLQVARRDVLSETLSLVSNFNTEHWKKKFEVTFEGEPGLDFGGVQREWLRLLFKNLMNPYYGLFREVRPGCGMYTIDEKSPFNNESQLQLFSLIGKLMAKAIYEKIPVQCHLVRYLRLSLLRKPILGLELKKDDPDFFSNVNKLKDLNNDELDAMNLNFSYEIEAFGEVQRRIDLEPFDSSTQVTASNVHQYVNSRLLCTMTTAIEEQIAALCYGFNSLIPHEMIATFSPSELELLLCGHEEIDVAEMKAHAIYQNCDSQTEQVKWLWRAVESFSNKDKATFLCFVTGCDRVSFGGFNEINGGHPLTIMLSSELRNDQLPMSHTCFNRLELAKYQSYDTLQRRLSLAIAENSEGFGIE